MAIPLPLVRLAISVFPEIARLVAGPHAEQIAEKAVEAVKSETNTSDPEKAEKAIREDPEVEAKLRIRLAEIQLEGERLEQKEAVEKRKIELEEFERRLGDVKSARSSMLALVQRGSALGWGAALISIIVTVGFFSCLFVLIFAPPENSQTLDIITGALVAAFTAVINFWIGSSSGSQNKDKIASLRSAEAAEQFSAALKTQSEQSRIALENAKKLALSAGASPVLSARPSTKAESRFDACLKIVLASEGGFSDHPADRGGMTNFGITRSVYAEFLDKPVDEVTEEMMREISLREVREIYRAGYWIPPRCEELPAGLDLSVFDFSVNAGPRRAVRMLQGCLEVKVDGSVGPITLAAAGACNLAEMISLFAELRLAYYQGLKGFDTFGRGWIKRANFVRDESLKIASFTLAEDRL